MSRREIIGDPEIISREFITLPAYVHIVSHTHTSICIIIYVLQDSCVASVFNANLKYFSRLQVFQIIRIFCLISYQCFANYECMRIVIGHF